VIARWLHCHHEQPADIASLSREELLALVAKQQRQITKLQGQLGEAITTIKTLQGKWTGSSGSKNPSGTLFQLNRR
jgi:uncharacterized protein YukE